MGDISTDYKAQKLNDTIVIVASVATSATQSGTSTYQRTVQTANGITGLAGALKTTGLNPLFNAQLFNPACRAGSNGFEYNISTSLTGLVIAVLPSGNLVVEAQRRIFMNNQHEDITVRGVVRPGDIGTGNTIHLPSSAILKSK